ncbi:MAG: SAVED domain-containing protein [Pyrinomonadaceae bacterium]
MRVEESAAVRRYVVDATAIMHVEEDAEAVLFPSRHERGDLEDAPRLHDGRSGRGEQISEGKLDKVGEAKMPSDTPYVCGDQVAGDMSAIIDAFGAGARGTAIPSGDSIAYVFNIKGSALRDVRGYIEENSLPVKAILAVEPAGSFGALSIADDREAVSLALSARDELHKALTRHDVRITHLFFYGPFALSVFVGQLLAAIGQVQLYEFQDPGYVPSATLKS